MTQASNQKRNDRRCTTPAAISHSGNARNTVNETKTAILITFLSILVKGNIHYCEPRPNSAIELLKKFHGIEIGRRWFFQCMLDLEDAGLMRRQRRWYFQDDLEIRSNSSLWWFTIKGAKFLTSKMIRGAKELLHIMVAWLHRGDTRKPGPSDISPRGEITERSVALARLQELLATIGSGPVGGSAPAPT